MTCVRIIRDGPFDFDGHPCGHAPDALCHRADSGVTGHHDYEPPDPDQETTDADD